ncbi:NAD-dependent epimerase/dehydratase family protein [Nannocystis sp. SCPEA4]|uniref:NAD-dependent epimerase/dehydratase family protein n=1 Tax=Nannocystis sp. SCPEA4 TaxID=2996787 RepID=UPI0022707B27|nr:NAD-dependent epimerase/dehydratase family protein [Nannocystis sp. SCPEA4]MCY1061400.1 NAD-dependent epimerase/dehydratase family protein [Nannocystis sp. SCPEA4]
MTAPRTSLVTGGCGFLGRFLVDALVRRGDRVTVLDHKVDRWRDDVQFVAGDICDPELVARTCAGQSVVYHNASLVHTKHSRVEQVRAVNIDGTRNVLAACRKGQVPKLVYVSSASVVYEGRDIERGDETLPYARQWLAPYAETKRIAEEEVLSASGQDGVLTCAIRPHMIFGPGDTRLLPAILTRARTGKLKFTVGAGDRLNDFTYVTNIVDSLLAADERLVPGSPAAGKAYFITNGEPMNFWEFVRRVLVGLGYSPPRLRIPYAVAYAAASARETFDTLVRGGTLHAEEGLSRFSIRYICTHHYFSYARATADLGYQPQVALLEGIRRTVEYFRAQGAAAV